MKGAIGRPARSMSASNATPPCTYGRCSPAELSNPYCTLNRNPDLYPRKCRLPNDCPMNDLHPRQCRLPNETSKSMNAFGAAFAPNLLKLSRARNASSCDDFCLLVPTYTNRSGIDKSHSSMFVRLLQRIGELATDRVPIFVVVDRAEDVGVLQRFVRNHHNVLTEYRSMVSDLTILSMEQIMEARGEDYESSMAVAHGIPTMTCEEGTGQRVGIQRMGGHMKKFYGLRHLEQHGCSLTWVMDDDSVPLRRFSFCEIARNGYGKVLAYDVADGSSFQYTDPAYGRACLDAAQSIHQLPLSNAVRQLDFRQNDFWLIENELASTMMREAVAGRESSSFVRAYANSSGHGQVGEQIVWMSWLAEKMVRGVLPAYSLMSRGGSSFVQDCLRNHAGWGRTRGTATISRNVHTMAHYAAKPQDWECLGKLLQLQGQAGLRGAKLSGLRYRFAQPQRRLVLPIALQGLLPYMSWCLSNCYDNILTCSDAIAANLSVTEVWLHPSCGGAGWQRQPQGSGRPAEREKKRFGAQPKDKTVATDSGSSKQRKATAAESGQKAEKRTLLKDAAERQKMADAAKGKRNLSRR